MKTGKGSHVVISSFVTFKCFSKGVQVYLTLPETNVAPENRPPQ